MIFLGGEIISYKLIHSPSSPTTRTCTNLDVATTLIPGPKCGMRHATRVNESQRSRLWHYCGANLPASCAGAAAGALWMWKSRSETEIAVQCGSCSRRVAVQDNDDGGRLQLRSRSRSCLDHNHNHNHNHDHDDGHGRSSRVGIAAQSAQRYYCYATILLLLC